MKTKIVYVLVSEETDYYYEMVLLSLYSLRLYHPKGDTEVELVMDETTHQRLVEKKAAILDDVTPIVTSIPPEYTKMQRSRYLKTRLRRIVKGNFLYIDCDTIICNRLDDIDNVDATVAMVSDENRNNYLKSPHKIELCNKAGFSLLENQPYFNSGVIYVQDTSLSCLFFEEWNRLWNQSLLSNVPQDQPALCMANVNVGQIVTELPSAWNLQCRNGIGDNHVETKILHYYSSGNSYMRKNLFDFIRRSDSMEFINPLVQNPMTLGVSVFTISDERLMRFVYSDILYLYDTKPRLCSFLNIFSNLLLFVHRQFSKVHNMIR